MEIIKYISKEKVDEFYKHLLSCGDIIRLSENIKQTKSMNAAEDKRYCIPIKIVIPDNKTI